jgi:hypothetical protein
MEKPFVSQRPLIPKLALYFYIFLSLLFLIMTPLSYVTRASTGEDGRLGFALLIGMPLVVIFYVFRNYIIKINDKKVSVYLPLGIKWKTFYLNNITHYKLIQESIDEGYNRRLHLFTNKKEILKINSYRYWNSDELFKTLIDNLNKDVKRLRDK